MTSLTGMGVASQELAGAILPHFVGYRDHSEINSVNNSKTMSVSEGALCFSAGMQSHASKILAGKELTSREVASSLVESKQSSGHVSELKPQAGLAGLPNFQVLILNDNVSVLL